VVLGDLVDAPLAQEVAAAVADVGERRRPSRSTAVTVVLGELGSACAAA
jgi:hypothetical protein